MSDHRSTDANLHLRVVVLADELSDSIGSVPWAERNLTWDTCPRSVDQHLRGAVDPVGPDAAW